MIWLSRGKFRNLVGNIIAVYGFYRSPKALGQLHMFFQAFLIAGIHGSMVWCLYEKCGQGAVEAWAMRAPVWTILGLDGAEERQTRMCSPGLSFQNEWFQDEWNRVLSWESPPLTLIIERMDREINLKCPSFPVSAGPGPTAAFPCADFLCAAGSKAGQSGS